MSHWFDNLCLRMGDDRPPVGNSLFVGDPSARRGFLKGILTGTALGVLDFSRPAWGTPAQYTGQKPVRTTVDHDPPFRNLAPDQCQRTWTGARMNQVAKLAQGGITFQQTLNFDRTTKSLTHTIVVMQGGSLVVSATGTGQTGGASTVKIDYGSAVSGIRSASFTSSDGKTLRGTIDGRAVIGIQGTRSAVHTEFLDHRPGPTITAAPALGVTVGALARQLRGRTKACIAVSGSPGGRGPIRTLDYKPGGNGPGDPGDGWYGASGATYNAPDCDGCWNNCGDKAKEYSGIEDWETYLCAPCFAAAVLAFNAIWLGCWGTCQLPGGGCCPVPCGGAGTCCGRNDNCFRGDLCCPASMVVCNNVCCGFNISTCSADGTCGCPTGMVSCSTQCCAAGEICCNGICAPAGGCDNGCVKPAHFCNGTCCAPFSACCNGQCCKDICLNNTCCPASQVCGNTCCAKGQVCNNGSCLGCPSGPHRIRSFPCHSLGPNNVTLGTCCSRRSPTCCGGVCCGIGQDYCVAANGTYVCTNVNPDPIR